MRLLILAIAATASPCVVHAQANPDLPENITVTATRVPTTVENLPAGVTVIDRKTIEERGYLSLVDALQAVPGLRVVQSGGPGSQASVFVRGTNSNHVLVLIDGVPINDPGDPGGAFNFGVDTLADVERIEIVRGPISSLYGTGAIGGVINLITRHGRGAPHGHLTLAAGAPRAGLAQGDVSGGFGIYDYAAQLQGLSEYGFDQTPKRQTVYTGEPDGDRSKLAQLELGVTPMPDTRFSVLLRARDAKYGFDEAYGGITYDGGNATGYDAALFGRAGVTSKFLDGAGDTSLYITRLQTDRRYTVTLDAADPNQAVGDSRYHGRRTDTQWNNTVHLPDEGAFTANSVTFGFEQQSDQADTNLNTRSVSFGFPVLDRAILHAHDDAAAGYFGAQSTVLGRLALTGQLREDATTVAGDAFTWRAGGVLDLHELSSHIHVSYGTSFRAPALYDRYGIDSFGYRGNPHLRPEHAQAYEAGWTLDIPWTRTRSASVSATYFDNRIRDLIETAYAPDFLSSTQINVEHARAHGVETTLTLRASLWLQADLTYTYTNSRYTSNFGTSFSAGMQQLRRPYNQWSGNVRLTPIHGVVIAPELLYIGAFQDFPAGNDGVQGFAVGRSPSGLIFNLNATWQVTRAVELFAWGKNLGNSRFEPVSGYATPGASVLAGTRLSF